MAHRRRKYHQYNHPRNQRGKVPRVLLVLDDFPGHTNFNGPEFQFEDINGTAHRDHRQKAKAR